ncbi:flippase-like domain-containing protein [archaeon]|nr:flippase-like domain-containing protein [archaeon]
MQTKRILKLLLQLLIIGGIAFFFAKTLYYYWNEIKGSILALDYFYLAFAVMLMAFIYFITAFNYNKVLIKIGARLPARRVIRVRILSDMAAYIPGKIWTVLGRFYFLKDEQIRKEDVFFSIVIELALIGITGIFISALTLLLWKGNPFFYNFYILAFIALSCLALLHPKVFGYPVNFLLELLKRPTIEMGMKYADMLELSGFYLFYWAMHGVLLYLIINTINPISISLLPVMFGLYSASWVAGFLTFLTPAGLGIREGILSYLLSFFMPLPIAMVIALLFRIIQMLIGGVLALIVLRM